MPSLAVCRYPFRLMRRCFLGRWIFQPGTWKWGLYQLWLVLSVSQPWIIKHTGGLGNNRTNGDYINSYIIKTGDNAEESSGNLRRLAVTQISVGDHQLMLIKKNSEGINDEEDNYKCRLCSDKNKTIHPIISECSKLAQREWKMRHEWVGKIIHWELCKKKIFHLTIKCYKHWEELIKRMTQPILWNFEIQAFLLISARKTN